MRQCKVCSATRGCLLRLAVVALLCGGISLPNVFEYQYDGRILWPVRPTFPDIAPMVT